AAVARDAHTDRIRGAVTGLRELGIDPATSPSDLITRAEQQLADLAPQPPEIAREHDEHQEPEASREPAEAQAAPEQREDPGAEPKQPQAPEPREPELEPARSEAEARLESLETAELDRRAQRAEPELAAPAIAN